MDQLEQRAQSVFLTKNSALGRLTNCEGTTGAFPLQVLTMTWCRSSTSRLGSRPRKALKDAAQCAERARMTNGRSSVQLKQGIIRRTAAPIPQALELKDVIVLGSKNSQLLGPVEQQCRTCIALQVMDDFQRNRTVFTRNENFCPQDRMTHRRSKHHVRQMYCPPHRRGVWGKRQSGFKKANTTPPDAGPDVSCRALAVLVATVCP